MKANPLSGQRAGTKPCILQLEKPRHRASPKFPQYKEVRSPTSQPVSFPRNISSIRKRCNNTLPQKVASPISPKEKGDLPRNRTSDFSRTALLPVHWLTAALLFCLAPASWNQTRKNCGGRRHCLSDEMGEGENQPLTMTTFQSRSRTFFMGKCGARPLQNLVTIEKSRRAKGS